LNPFASPPDLGVLGQTLNGYWIGEIPIKVGPTTTGPPPPDGWGEATKAFCMQYDHVIYVGRKYSAQVTTTIDSAEWRAIAYLLTWYYPPADNDAAAKLQVAIWRLLNNTRGYNYVNPSWVPSDIDNAAKALVNLALGKDVVRGDDTFEWVKPVSGNLTSILADPGDIVTLTARITMVNGTGRANVKVQFSATKDGSPLAVSSTEIHTNSTGYAQVTVTVPPASIGSNIEVKASTRGVWPKVYLDLSGCPDPQDLIGFNTSYQLTVSTNVWILATIHVIPEVPLGTLAIVATCFSAYIVKAKKAKLTK